MALGTIYNPAAGATFYTTGGVGTASGEYTSGKVKGGAVLCKTTETLLDSVVPGRPASQPNTNGSVTFRGLGNGVGTAFLGSVINLSMTASGSPSMCHFSGNSVANRVLVNALIAGSYILITNGSTAIAPGSSLNMLYSTQKITAINASTGIFSTNLPYLLAYSGNTMTAYPNTTTRNFATQTAGKYIGQKITTQIAGVANSILQGCGNAGMISRLYGRSMNSRVGFRTTKITTGLRAGYFNRFTGKWTTAPSIADDSAITNSNMATDHAVSALSASAPGELTFQYGGHNLTTPYADSTTYSARTTW